MNVISTSIPDVKILEPNVFQDDRGYFMESYKESWFKQKIADVSVVQDNHISSGFGTLRGLHFQASQTQGKLARVIQGKVYDVAVDVRVGSKTYGKWVGVELSEENKYQMWVPAGFAHGFYVLSETAVFTYKCTDYYDPTSEVVIAYDDPRISIEWPCPEGQGPSISEKDARGAPFGADTSLHGYFV